MIEEKKPELIAITPNDYTPLAEDITKFLHSKMPDQMGIKDMAIVLAALQVVRLALMKSMSDSGVKFVEGRPPQPMKGHQ